MSALSNLKLVAVKKPTHMPAIVIRRNKLSSKLWEQIQLAQSQIGHTHFVVKRRVTVKDLEGNYKSIERPKRIKPWWFMDNKGNLCLSVFYGSKRIEFAPGKTSVEAKNLTELVKALEILKSATEAGNLDGAIEAASGALKLNFNKIR